MQYVAGAGDRFFDRYGAVAIRREGGLVDAVDEDDAGLRVMVGGAHDLLPEVARGDLAVYPRTILAPLRTAAALVLAGVLTACGGGVSLGLGFGDFDGFDRFAPAFDKFFGQVIFLTFDFRQIEFSASLVQKLAEQIS